MIKRKFEPITKFVVNMVSNFSYLHNEKTSIPLNVYKIISFRHDWVVA